MKSIVIWSATAAIVWHIEHIPYIWEHDEPEYDLKHICEHNSALVIHVIWWAISAYCGIIDLKRAWLEIVFAIGRNLETGGSIVRV